MNKDILTALKSWLPSVIFYPVIRKRCCILRGNLLHYFLPSILPHIRALLPQSYTKYFKLKFYRSNSFFPFTIGMCAKHFCSLSLLIILLSHALLSASYFFCLMVGELKLAHILLVMMFRFIR